MEMLHIDRQELTPEIDLNPNTGVMSITGRSVPGNAHEYYTPVLKWLESYKESPAPKTVFKVSLEYFNTSSSKMIWDIMKTLKALDAEPSTHVSIEWHYETDDEDLRDAALEYQELLGIDFKLIAIQSH